MATVSVLSVPQLAQALCTEYERVEAEGKERFLELYNHNVLLQKENSQLRAKLSEVDGAWSMKKSNTFSARTAVERHMQDKSKAVAASMTHRLSMRRQTSLADTDELNKHKAACSLACVVSDLRFEYFFAMLIMLNTAVMAVELQYEAFSMGYTLNFQGYSSPSEEVWPGGKALFEKFEIFFGVVFSIELLLKLAGWRCSFFHSVWNYFDGLVVISWIISQSGQTLLINPLILRLFRMVRFMRLMKVMKSSEAFDSLRLLIRSLFSCMPALVWASLALFMIQTLVGMIFSSIFAEFIVDADYTLDIRTELFEYFGSFSRCMVTMFELTLGNWIPVCRFLMENISEWWCCVIILYKLVVGFGVIRIISGVFLHETFKAAASDDDLMILNKKRLQHKHQDKMRRFMQRADSSGDGGLSRQEFIDVLKSDDVKVWLSAQEIDAGDADLLFDLLDDGDETLTVGELTSGIARLKGTARSIDLFALMHMVANLHDMYNMERLRRGSLDSDDDGTLII